MPYKKITYAFVILLFILPSVSSAAALTQQQSTSLIAVVQSSPGTPASAFVSLITAFSNITINQATSLITVVQVAPGVPANAFVNLLTSFTIDIPTTQPKTPATVVPAIAIPVTQTSQQTTQITQNTPPTPTPTPVTPITPAPTTIPVVVPPTTPTPIITPQAPTPAPIPQLKITITSDKNSIGANGQDVVTIIVKVTNADNTPAVSKTVIETNPKNQTFTTDTNGIVTFTVTTTQSGTLNVDITVNGQNSRLPISAISTNANISTEIYLPDGRSSSILMDPASDQIVAFIGRWNLDSSISNLQIKSIKIKLTNLNESWFKNVRIVNSEPCTKGRFCIVKTISGPASYSLQGDMLTVTPNTPVDIYPDGIIWVIADMLNPTSTHEGTNYPLITYQISVPGTSAIELTGKVNGYDINTLSLNLKSGTTPVTTTVNSNYCMSSSGIVACY